MAIEHPGARAGGYLTSSTSGNRTKTQEDRYVELCPRALEVLSRHLALRREYVSAGKIHHENLFFLGRRKFH
jgi:hypothetical protein